MKLLPILLLKLTIVLAQYEPVGRSLNHFNHFKISSPDITNTTRPFIRRFKKLFVPGFKERTTAIPVTTTTTLPTTLPTTPTTPTNFIKRKPIRRYYTKTTPLPNTPKPKKLKRILVKKYANIARDFNRNVIPLIKLTSSTTTSTTTIKPEDNEESASFENYEVSAEDIFDTSEMEDYNNVTRGREGRGASGIDPHHPAVQSINSINGVHNNNIVNKPIRKTLHKKSHASDSLVPMDKTLVYVGMIFSWIFWIVVFTTYYTWGQKHGHPVPGKPGFYKNRPVVLNINHNGAPQFVQTRSLEETTWNCPEIIYMISLAQESYEKFDYKSIECQKKAICELNENVEGSKAKGLFDLLDTIEPLLPTNISAYLKEYKKAFNFQSCSDLNCSFSLTDVFDKFNRL